jgi:beta-glucuronidase
MQGEFRDIQTSQMEEMITAHYNHPSIYAWGLCNEIHGQSEKAHAFVRRGIEIAREIDPSRLLTWASNSLQKTPEKDASGLVDFIEWNDYYESWFGGNLTALEKNLKAIADAFPEKSLVISEYGLCECDPKNPVGDGRRIEILETHTERYRKASNVAGAIFFDYNDYRTHIGDKGEGAFRQRVHGVVDLLGRRKPSWSALRAQSSPVRKLGISAPQTESETTRATVDIQTRSLENDLPAYTLRGYSLVWTAYNDLGHPLQNGNIPLPELPPGSRKEIDLVWKDLPDPARIYIEIFRPTGYSVTEAKWIR